MKIGKYDVTIKDGDTELDSLPSDLPVFDFEGNVVTYEEAKGGYLRQSDYSKKTAEVADMRKLFDELGVADPRRGVGIMRHLLGVVAELEEKGIIDPNTGDIIEQQLGQEIDNLAQNQDQLSPALQKQLKELQQRLGSTERDMGALLSIMSKRDIETAFPELTETHLEWVFGMARDNPEKSPMEYAKALNTQLEEWGQKTIDEHALKAEELKKQELERVPGAEGLDMFEEDVTFSFSPERHGEDAKVVSPGEAAKQYMEAALAREE
jgi:hypothetical protein